MNEKEFVFFLILLFILGLNIINLLKIDKYCNRSSKNFKTFFDVTSTNCQKIKTNLIPIYNSNNYFVQKSGDILLSISDKNGNKISGKFLYNGKIIGDNNILPLSLVYYENLEFASNSNNNSEEIFGTFGIVDLINRQKLKSLKNNVNIC